MNSLKVLVFCLVLLLPVSALAEWTAGWQKPLLGVEINKSHPIAHRLVGAWVCNEAIGDTATNYTNPGRNDGTLTGSTCTWKVGEKGAAVQVTGDGVTDRINIGSVAGSNPLSGYGSQVISMAALVYKAPDPGNNSYWRMIDISDGANASNGWALWWYTSNNEWLVAVDGTVIGDWTADSAIVTGGHRFVGVVINAKTDSHDLYLDGSLYSTESTAVTFNATTVNGAIGNWNHAADRQWNGHIYYVYVWNRVVTAAEFAQLYSEPYCMFVQFSAARFYSPAGAPSVIPTPYYYRIITSWNIPSDYWDDKIELLPTGTDG